MRAGAFSDKRVIDLLNRRFVNFYYNRSGVGLGADEAAKKFATGKTRNKYAFFAAFDASGKWLGETELYADKDDVFNFLTELTRQHPEYFETTATEKAVLAGANSKDRNKKWAAANLNEELGHLALARELYGQLAQHHDSFGTRANLAAMRIHRYLGHWAAHQAAELSFAKAITDNSSKKLRAQMAVEKAHRLISQKDYSGVLTLLRPHCFESLESGKIAEIHFLCGVANWFLKARNWAKFHFCWVVENTSESRIVRRAYIAAAAESMPYENPALGGYRASTGNIGPQDIIRGYEGAKRVYLAMKEKFAAKDWSTALATKDEAKQVETSTFLLVAKLVDGNSHRINNNRIVKELKSHGRSALPSLIAAIEDAEFPGRGYAAWALSQVMKKHKIDDELAMDVLRKTIADEDPYVSALARSGLGSLK